MIARVDLAAVLRAATPPESDRGDADRTIVSRMMLRAMHDEIVAGRAAQAELARRGAAFGLGPGVTL